MSSAKRALVALAAVLLGGCGGSTAAPRANAPSSSPTPSVSSTPSGGPVVAPSGARPTKVLLFVLENHAQSQALASMPYLSSLATRYGRTTSYHAITHPSLPNYLALVGGSTFGVHDDAAPSAHRLSGESVFDQALAKGLTAKLYAESMPSNCFQRPAGSYAVKHNPWAYFTGSTQRANCDRNDVPMGTPSAGALANDIASGTLPDVAMAIPNLCNDAHDCSLATADNWLRRWVPTVMAGSDYRDGRLAVVVTFDEDDHGSSNNVLTVVDSSHIAHVASSSPYTHYSWLRCAEDMLGVPALGEARTAVSMCPGFLL